MQQVFIMISIEPAPMLEDKEKWFVFFSSYVLHYINDKYTLLFVIYTLHLKQHIFIEKCKYGASAMLPKIEKAKINRVAMALEEEENVASKTIP
uniref:Uncharacterized protein n=1 Tax=Lactuca sativa TaxID=4236 RepID=A0A9R1UGP9_LACSA|nr:hypothetical protein LSAT_V11C900486790 [Lactuca sativa]